MFTKAKSSFVHQAGGYLCAHGLCLSASPPLPSSAPSSHSQAGCVTATAS